LGANWSELQGAANVLTVIAICVGASLGALGRWQLSGWLNSAGALLPWGTLASN